MSIVVGPIHSPDLLRQYKDIDPSFPGRILAEVERNAEHRRGVEKEKSASEAFATRAGAITGPIIVVISLAMTWHLSVLGKSIGSLSGFVVALAILIATLYRRKRPAMPPDAEMVDPEEMVEDPEHFAITQTDEHEVDVRG